MASVKYDHLIKTFGDVIAVNDLNIEIADKEFLVLVGPSGCGKTTALRCLAGLEDITSGQILIDDVVVNDIAPKDRDIAMVFQSYALYPHMSVFDNMAFGLRLRKTPKDEIKKRVEAAAQILSIENLLDRKPRQLSGGQRQRVALGRAIVREPKVFLLDEPLSNLDAKLRVQMRAELGKLHHQLQTTFIYVTHDQTEAMTMASRIAVINLGVLQQIDTPQVLYNTPANKFVAGFIGSPAMNFFDAHIQKDGGNLYVDGGTFSVKIPSHRAPAYQDYVGKAVFFGIRPEDVHNPQYTPPEIMPEPVECKIEV
ncbi:MAG: sn-glycerol-3-phosphate ABC transporter ATP-binding protein UgpC, partial [Anaerolineales bacterium]|nr:sn-glycerol-3-phosphate ABC transporter ATP-binding protein UgpC [Anaerolineales bacterium]